MDLLLSYKKIGHDGHFSSEVLSSKQNLEWLTEYISSTRKKPIFFVFLHFTDSWSSIGVILRVISASIYLCQTLQIEKNQTLRLVFSKKPQESVEIDNFFSEVILNSTAVLLTKIKKLETSFFAFIELYVTQSKISTWNAFFPTNTWINVRGGGHIIFVNNFS